MREINESLVQQLHEGPEGPMLPWMTYHQYSLTTEAGKERSVYAPETASSARKHLTQFVLRARVAVENALERRIYNDPASPIDHEV